MESRGEINIESWGLPFGIKDNPTNAELEKIKEAQDASYQQLMLKDHWSNEDFTLVFYSRQEWKGESGQWRVSIDSMQQLASDSRTPLEKAVMLHGILTTYRNIQS